MATIVIRKLSTNGTVIMTWTLPTFDNFGYDLNTPATPTPLPEEDQSENILMKIEGNSGSISMAWVMKNSPTNQITGSGFVGNSATIFEQILGAKNQFRPISIDDGYQIAIVDGSTDLISWKGTITKMHFQFSSGEPVNARVSITFMEGTVVTMYGLDGAKQPTNFIASTGGLSGEVNLSWTNPTDTGTGNPPLAGYRVQYKTGNADWTTVDFTPSATSRTITGLTPSTSYKFRIAATTAETVGQYSQERTATSGA